MENKVMMKQRVASILLAGAAWAVVCADVVADAGSGLPEGFPPEVPDYAGVTADNFWEGRYRDDNPHGGYAMPKIDPATAIVVDRERGKDDNPGTAAAPFQTIARGIQELKAGAVLLIRAGNYRVREPLTLKPEQSGTAEAPVLISSYPGEYVSITAAEPVTGVWQESENRDYWSFTLPEGENETDWHMLFVDGVILPSAGQAEYAATGNRDVLKTGSQLGAEEPKLPRPGSWGVREGKVHLRLVDNTAPAGRTIEVARNGNAPLFKLDRVNHLILNRLVLEKAPTLVNNTLCNRLVIRHCIMRQAATGINGNGKDAVEPLFLDHCLMEHNGGYRGNNIYCLTPMNIRYSLFRHMPPEGAAVTAYTSTPNQFHNVHILGNTFLHTGSCIYLVSGNSSVKHNLALVSRFVSSSGKTNLVADNFVVYDGRDKEAADTPRREIGFRMYADGSTVSGNTFIGFDRGMLVRQKSEAKSSFTGNRFFGFTQFGLHLTGKENLEFKDNLFVPAGEAAVFVSVGDDKDGPETKHDLKTFESWGFASGNRMLREMDAPPLPNVISEAIVEKAAVQLLPVKLHDAKSLWADGAWRGLSLASDGCLYLGLCSHDPDRNAVVMKFAPADNSFTPLLDVGQALKMKTGDTAPMSHGKIHTPFLEIAGHLYFATTFAPVSEALHRNRPYAGGVVFSMDIAGGKTMVLAKAPAGEGIITLDADPQRKLLYAVTIPSGLLLRIDIATGAVVDCGATAPLPEAEKGQIAYVEAVRSLAIHPDTGKVYGSRKDGSIWVYAPAAGKIEETGLNVLQGVVGEASEKAKEWSMWRMIVFDPETGSFYGTHRGTASLFRFDPQNQTITPLARLSTDPDREPANPKDTARLALVLRNGVFYHLTQDEPAAVADQRTRNPEYQVHLVSYDLATGKHRNHGALTAAGGRRVVHGDTLEMLPDGRLFALAFVELTDPVLTWQLQNWGRGSGAMRSIGGVLYEITLVEIGL
jgi:hypothetical protein